MKEISISGSDGVGKTQQISLLAMDGEGLQFTGRLTDYSDRWPKLAPADDFNWWFKEVPFHDFVSIVTESLRNRRAACVVGRTAVHDRGVRMFKAVCAATMVARGESAEVDAARIVDELFLKAGVVEDGSEILLRISPTYQEETRQLREVIEARDQKYLPWQNELYARYQKWLAIFMDHYFSGLSSANVITVNDCILGIQTQLRESIGGMGYPVSPMPCGNLKKLVAFGGLSESGKSSYADRLRTHHGYSRLKIKYFDDVVRDRGLASCPETIASELLVFLDSHKHLTHVSIESLHNANLPAYLKLLFGSRMKIVYLDVPQETRVARTSHELGISVQDAAKKVAEKDAVKIERGADKVAEIADIVFRNEVNGFESGFSKFIDLL